MIQTILIAGAIFALAIVGMAIGAIVAGRRLRGSCGSLAGERDEEGNVRCSICSDPSPECQGEPEDEFIRPDASRRERVESR